jgi:hypothetical protein
MLVMELVGLANILFYTLFYCDLLTLTLPSSIQSLDLLPFLLGLFDFVENILIVIILMVAPYESAFWGIVGYPTLVKTILCTYSRNSTSHSQ